MKIQCDVCEKAPATVICCADEAALCSNCDVEIHAANKLASKHQRLLLECLSSKLPRCDICQEKAAFIFCVEDRALFCRDCDEAIHLPGSLSGKHQRFLATGIRVALASSSCTKESEQAFLEPPNQNPPAVAVKMPVSGYNSPSWAVDDLLQLPDFGSGDKKDHMGFGELEWVSDIDLFDEQAHQEALAAAEVPELFTPNLSKPQKSSISHKKPRLEICDPEDYFTVPDLG